MILQEEKISGGYNSYLQKIKLCKTLLNLKNSEELKNDLLVK
jgi:hypothetical protein